MSQALDPSAGHFIDRRDQIGNGTPGVERRQFTNSHESLTADAREVATAIDAYKIKHRRRFITFEEMMNVIRELGYSK